MTADIDALRSGRGRGTLTSPFNGEVNVRQLLTMLADQVEDHPPSTWSCELLSVVINAIDIEFGKGIPGGGIDSGSRHRLTVVR